MPRRKKTKRWRHINAKFFVVFIFLLCGSGASVYHYVNATSDPEILDVAVDPNIGIRPFVEEFFTANEAPEMIKIVQCESQFKHFNTDGTVLKNRAGSSAIGVAQILTSKHPDPKVLKVYNLRNDMDLTVDDFDLTTLEGNLAYALALYEVRGTRDWECAKKFRFPR